MLFLLLYQMVVHLELEDVPEEELDVGWPRVHDDVEDLLLFDLPRQAKSKVKVTISREFFTSYV